jgi:hypothetical protein
VRNGQFRDTEIQGVVGDCSLSVLNRGKDGQEGKYVRGKGRAGKGTKKGGQYKDT